MDYPDSRNWKAQEAQADSAGGPWTLSVSGEVKVPASSPALVVYQRDESGSRIRLEVAPVDFADDDTEPNGDPGMTWRKVGFTKSGLDEPLYNEVMVLYQDFVLAEFGVQIIHS